MLATRTSLSREIQQLIKNNKNPDSDKAIKEFGDGLAKIILELVKEADVVIPPGSANIIVTTPTGAGTGINTAEIIGNLR